MAAIYPDLTTASECTASNTAISFENENINTYPVWPSRLKYNKKEGGLDVASYIINTNYVNWRVRVKYNPSSLIKEKDYTGYFASPYSVTFEQDIYNAWGTTGTATYGEYVWPSPTRVQNPVAAGDRLREIIRSRQAPAVAVRQGLAIPQDIREFRARETLRRLIGDEAFRGYLTKGFITVTAKSGRVYQIRPGHGFTRVWDKGKPVQQLCVVLSGDFAPTDSVIMRYILVLNDEEDFWRRANKQGLFNNTYVTKVSAADQRPLMLILKELKGGRSVTEVAA